MKINYISLSQVCFILSVSSKTVYRMVNRDDLKAYRVGKSRRLYFSEDEVLEALKPV